MCSRGRRRGQTFAPGDTLTVQTPSGPVSARWDGFARSETAARTWRGHTPVEIAFDEVGERHDQTRQLRYAPVPVGKVVAGLLDPRAGVVRVLTQAANPKQAAYFGHDRVPVLALQHFPEAS